MKRLFFLMFLLLALFGCNFPDRPATDAAIEAFSFRHSGMSTEEIYTYSVRKDGGRYLADFDLFCQFEFHDVPLEDEDAAALKTLMDEYSLREWNGFAKSNSFVLDGESFGLSAAFADGKTLQASGNNAFPRGYHEGAAAIKRFFAEIMDKHGIDPWEDDSTSMKGRTKP